MSTIVVVGKAFFRICEVTDNLFDEEEGRRGPEGKYTRTLLLFAGWVGRDMVRLTVPLPPTGIETVSSWCEIEERYLLEPAGGCHSVVGFVDL